MLLTFFINLPQEMKLVLLFLLGGLILIKLYEIFMNSRLKMRFIHEKGVLNQKELIGDELLAVKDYFEKSQYTGFVIDDITSHDLDIDSLFNLMNNTQTNIGQEVLYAKLRRPLYDMNELNQFNALIQSYQSNDQVRGESQYLLFKIPFLSKYQSFYSNFLRLKNLKSNKIHLISLLGLIIGILLLFVSFDIGVPIIGAALVINPMTYLYFSNQTSLQVKASQVITSSLSQLEKLLKINPEATTYLKKDAQEVLKTLSPLKRGSWIADEAPGSILPLKSILFYLTHINYVYFYHMLDKLQKHPEQVEKLMEIIGEIECAICVANLRVSEITTNIPILNETEFCSFTDLIHPLVENCVPNSLSIEQPILITGSNASGKSTFLKAVALNLICAQSLMTTFSQSFKSPFYKVLSSMALKDDLKTQQSYFMVEIASLNRIVNEPQDIKVFGFIDEILRGTNTLERIAASSTILHQLSQSNKMFMAATHDIELTRILENDVKNIHFSETFVQDDLEFDYQVKHGPSQTRNAIKLLEINGYDAQIIQKANELLKEFEMSRKWEQF